MVPLDVESRDGENGKKLAKFCLKTLCKLAKFYLWKTEAVSTVKNIRSPTEQSGITAINGPFYKNL